ncbi:MAG: YybH family protein [Acidobacteriota bacterium]
MKEEYQMTTETEVRNASAKFYAALNRMMKGDAASFGEIWSHEANVTTMHPIGGRETGWDNVRKSFEQVASMATGGQVKLEKQFIQVSADMACEVGIEQGQITIAGQTADIAQRVTNVYRRESGGWKIVHHHTDISQPMLDILSRLQK